MRINSKKKGNRGEVEAAHLLEDWFPGSKPRRRATGEEAGRHYLGCDIIDEADVIPFAVQVGIGKRPNPRIKFEEAAANSEGRPGMALTRQDRHGWLVTLPADIFGDMMSALHSYAEVIASSGINLPRDNHDDLERAVKQAASLSVVMQAAPFKDVEAQMNGREVSVAFALDPEKLRALLEQDGRLVRRVQDPPAESEEQPN